MSQFKKPVPRWVWALILALCLSPCLCCGLLVAVDSGAGASDVAIANETPQDHATRLAKQALGDHIQSVTYSNGEVDVEENIGQQWDNSTARDDMQSDCYTLQHVMFTSLLNPTAVTLTINGPLQDKHGNTSDGQYGYCTLSAQTASQFSWDNLTTAQAWDAYDVTWMRPEIQNAS